LFLKPPPDLKPGTYKTVDNISWTPDLAKTYAIENAFDRQRNRINWNVNKIADDVLSENWIEGSTPIQIAVLPDGSQRLLDGHHRSFAVISMDRPLNTSVTFRSILPKNGENIEKTLSDIYVKLNEGASMSRNDKIYAYFREWPDKQRSELRSLSMAYTLLGQGFTRTGNRDVKPSLQQVVESIKAFPVAATAFCELLLPTRGIKNNICKVYREQAVAGVILATLLGKQPQAAWEFWRRVADGQGRNVHEANLFAYLQDGRHKTVKVFNRQPLRRGESKEVYQEIATFWNCSIGNRAYIKGVKPSRTPGGEEARLQYVRIDETPFTGKAYVRLIGKNWKID
jgi:hypothetical protein